MLGCLGCNKIGTITSEIDTMEIILASLNATAYPWVISMGS